MDNNLFKYRPGGFGKRRTQGRAVAPKITTEVKTPKTVVHNHKKAAVSRIDPKFTDPQPTRRLQAKDLYSYRQIGTTKNWEDTIFTKTFAVSFINAMESLPYPEEGYAVCIKDLVARQYREISSYAMFLGVEIRHKDLDNAICLPYVPILNLTNTAILEQLVFLRKEDRFLKPISSNMFEITLNFVKQLTGSGVKPGQRLEKEFKGVTPNNVTKFCLPIAILQGICHLEHQENREDQKVEEKWTELMNVCDEDENFQQAEEMLRSAGMAPDRTLPKKENYTIEDVRMLQNYYAHQYQFAVFAEQDNKKPIFTGQSLMGKNIIGLICKDGHYQYIHSIPQFVGMKYYCVDCKVRYATLMNHYNCPQRCRLCNLFGCQAEGVEIKCEDCKVTFYSKKCEESHRKPLEKGSKLTICGLTLYCEECGTNYRKYKGHACNTAYCQHCRTFRLKGHTCIMSAKIKAGVRAVSQKLIFVQIQYENVEDDEGRRQQKPLLAMALRCCKECRDELHVNLDRGVDLTCEKCSFDDRRLHFFRSFNTEECVLDVLFNFLVSKDHERYTVVFHGIPDCVNEYLLNYAVSDATLKTKGILMTDGQLKVVDSKHLFPYSLEQLASAVNVQLPFRLVPQGLIREDNLNYVGTIPKLDIFLNEFDSSDKDLVVKYHRDLGREPYILLNELLNYTYNKLILHASAVSYIDSMSFEHLQVRLVEETSDLLSASLLSFRRAFFTDGILSLDLGISSRFNNSSSLQAMEYLAWRTHHEQLPIDSSMNVGEYRIPGTPYYCDGFIHPCDKYPRGLVIEIHGCYWHAHGCNYIPQMVPRRELDLEKINRQDTTKKEVLSRMHEFEVVWECEIAELREKREVRDFLSSFVYEGPVEILAALYPPRSEVFCHTAESDADYEIRVCDITSLPGKILREGSYPDCEMRRIHGDQFAVPIRTVQELQSQVKGIVYCQILAPSSLLLPVLPDSVNGKIVYHLCKACFEAGCEPCDHSEKERILTGTWTSFELEVALEQGYIITRVIGAIHWDSWMIYETEENHSLFSKYAGVVLNLEEMSQGKSESSDAGEIERRPNSLLARTAKTMMKVADKFSQRADYPTTRIVNSRTEMWRLFEDPTMLVREVKTVGKKLVVSAGSKLYTTDSSGDRKVSAKPIDTSVSIVPALIGGQQRARVYQAVTHDDIDLLYLDESFVVYRCPKDSDSLKYFGSTVFPGIQFTRFSSNASNHFVLETRTGETVTKTPGFDRMEDAIFARGQAIKSQTEQLIQGTPECVAIDYIAIEPSSQHILTCRKGTALIHTLSPYTRRIQSDGTTIPIGFVW